MSPHAAKPEIVWPDLDSSYVDEFGFINRTVYEIARNVWPAVVPSILRTLRDLHVGQTVMMKAAALVSRKLGEDAQKITSVHGYLYRTFIHLLSEEAQKEGKHAELNRTMLTTSDVSSRQSEEAAYEIVLIHQILERTDPETRKVFELRLLGYTFEEIAAQQGMRSNHLRSEWSKTIRRIAAAIESETRASERRLLRERPRKLVRFASLDPF